MPRPVTLFTGQWADLPFEQVAAKAGEWGFDGLEPACWGDHIDVVARVMSRVFGGYESLQLDIRDVSPAGWHERAAAAAAGAAADPAGSTPGPALAGVSA